LPGRGGDVLVSAVAGVVLASPAQASTLLVLAPRGIGAAPLALVVSQRQYCIVGGDGHQLVWRRPDREHKMGWVRQQGAVAGAYSRPTGPGRLGGSRDVAPSGSLVASSSALREIEPQVAKVEQVAGDANEVSVGS